MSNTPQKTNYEEGLEFSPKFDANGLIPCVVVSHIDQAVLMVAYMNDAALEATLASGEMHYWSRSRQELWHKGATSGMVQKLVEMRVDCDQDCLVAVVDMPVSPTHDGQHAAETSCHTGRRSCFYRKVLPPDSKDKSAVKLEFFE
ncbi:MAG: phosphoribosyl-AMP cyclohydrolase [Alphaproteobacteria bacterium]